MLDKPSFQPCYSVATIEPDQVFLVSERETVCLRDRFSYLVASLVNGDRSSDEIILGYGTHFDPKIALSRALTELNQILSSVVLVKVASDDLLVDVNV